MDKHPYAQCAKSEPPPPIHMMCLIQYLTEKKVHNVHNNTYV